MMHSCLFDSPKPYLFALNLKNSIAALLRYVILAKTIPIHEVLISMLTVVESYGISIEIQ